MSGSSLSLGFRGLPNPKLKLGKFFKFQISKTSFFPNFVGKRISVAFTYRYARIPRLSRLYLIIEYIVLLRWKYNIFLSRRDLTMFTWCAAIWVEYACGTRLWHTPFFSYPFADSPSFFKIFQESKFLKNGEII